jgi:tetratricopeptide (TPR) repeat protein
VTKATQEGRFQQALELAKQLNKAEPTSAHQALVHDAYLNRAKQLRDQGYTNDARTVLLAASQFPGDNAWRQRISQELAGLGEAQHALDLLGEAPAPEVRQQTLAQAADWAMQRGDAGKSLPLELLPQLEATRKAFTLLQAGQDDAAREALQGIGLQSPFLEWKLLIRGLAAYYQRDDSRAIENWQRLDANRLPAKLAAPLRFEIDTAFKNAQSPETQSRLRKLAARLQGPNTVATLRAIQAALGVRGEFTKALSLADSLVPALRVDAPHLAPRLRAIFYWTIVGDAAVEGVRHFSRVFGEPPDDPRLARMRALLAEQAGFFEAANDSWQAFERDVLASPEIWPGDQARLVSAIIWHRMGMNAVHAEEEDFDDDEFFSPFERPRRKPQKPKLDADECFRRSLELAPGYLESHKSLLHYHVQEQDDENVEKAARGLLQHFPEHVTTLVILGSLLQKRGETREGLEFLQRALKANPLDRKLRGQVGTAHLFHARSEAEAGRFDEARAQYQASLSYHDDKDDPAVLCKWAACEFKAGDQAKAEELLARALGRTGSRLAIAFSMLIEVIRLKLGPKLKKRFDAEVKAGFNEEPMADSVVQIAVTAGQHRAAGVTYHGQKTHEKNVVAYVDKASKVTFTEAQLLSLCEALTQLQANKVLQTFARKGKKRFRERPEFLLYEVRGTVRAAPYKIMPLLQKARRLVEAMPMGNERDKLLEQVDELEEKHAFSPFHPSFFGGFQGFVDPFGRSGYDEFDDGFGDEFDDGW